jgi:hypothetical protein
MPLDQHIEGSHGAREPRLKIRPPAVHDSLAMTDERQHGEDRLDEQTVLPLTALTQCEVGRIPLCGMEGGITQDDHASVDLANQPLKGLIRDIGGGTRPPHHEAILVQQQTEFARRDVTVLCFDIKVPATRLDLVPALMDGINRLVARYRPACTLIFACATVEVLAALKAHAPQYHYTLDIEPPPGLVLNPAAYSAIRSALEYGNSYATPARPRAGTLAPWTTHRRIVQHDLRLLNRLRRHAPEQPQPSLMSFTIDDEEELRTLASMGGGRDSNQSP